MWLSSDFRHSFKTIYSFECVLTILLLRLFFANHTPYGSLKHWICPVDYHSSTNRYFVDKTILYWIFKLRIICQYLHNIFVRTTRVACKSRWNYFYLDFWFGFERFAADKNIASCQPDIRPESQVSLLHFQCGMLFGFCHKNHENYVGKKEWKIWTRRRRKPKNKKKKLIKMFEKDDKTSRINFWRETYGPHIERSSRPHPMRQQRCTNGDRQHTNNETCSTSMSCREMKHYIPKCPLVCLNENYQMNIFFFFEKNKTNCCCFVVWSVVSVVLNFVHWLWVSVCLAVHVSNRSLVGCFLCCTIARTDWTNEWIHQKPFKNQSWHIIN